MPEPTPLQFGHKLRGGRYTLLKLLGRGSLGEVWLARDERLEETLALKFLPPQIYENRPALEVLRREIARSQKLTHPNIVRIHDLHEEPEEAPFIAVEYIEGPTLAAFRMQVQEGCCGGRHWHRWSCSSARRWTTLMASRSFTAI